MALADIVNVNITSASRSPSRPGFGTPLVLAYHTVLPGQRVLIYSAASALDSMVSDGFTTTGAVYKQVSAILQQNPAVTRVKIGRLSTAPTHTFTLKVLSALQGDVYKLTVNDKDIVYTVGAAATLTTVATALELLVEDAVNVDSVSAVDTITATSSTAGLRIRVANMSKNLEYTETTTYASVAADLTAIKAEDNDWYGVTTAWSSKSILKAVALWVEANEKIASLMTNDSAVKSQASTDDVMAEEKALAHARTWLVYNGKDTDAYTGAAMLGNRLPATPGSDTWAYKTLVGIPVDDDTTLSPTGEAAITSKNGNYYKSVNSINLTFNGKSPSGEWMDVVRFRDALKADIQVSVFAKLTGAPGKIPYTDLGAQTLAAEVRAALSRGVLAGGLRDDQFTSPVVTVARVDDQSTLDRAARKYNGIVWSAKLAGAIHSLTINGTVEV